MLNARYVTHGVPRRVAGANSWKGWGELCTCIAGVTTWTNGGRQGRQHHKCDSRGERRGGAGGRYFNQTE
jgi:hypothetical protein